jgi:hypothetical protein
MHTLWAKIRIISPITLCNHSKMPIASSLVLEVINRVGQQAQNIDQGQVKETLVKFSHNKTPNRTLRE